MSKKNIILLIAVGIIFILIPISAMYIDWGGGSDDAACVLIEQISPKAEYKPHINWGYEPTDKQETLLFVGQILIGLFIFGFSLYKLNKINSLKKKEKQI